MSISALPPRPAFHDLHDGSEVDRPPFSRLAYVAFIAGLLSLFAALSTILLPLAMLAMGLGVAVVWKLVRDRQIGGLWLAQIGLALSVAAIAWSVSARTGTDSYLYAEAGKHAKVFLDTLAAGQKYEALELKNVESGRQLTGTNLEKYYTGLSEEEQRSVDEFLSKPVVKQVMASGSQSDWQFVRGISVLNFQQQNSVLVEMTNRASAAKPQTVHVRMRRQRGLYADPAKNASVALWNVEELTSP